MKFADLKTEAGKLPANQMLDLRNFLTMLIGAGGQSGDTPRTTKSDDLATACLDAIVETMKSRGIGDASRGMLERTSQYPMFERKFREFLTEFFTRAAPTRSQRLAIMRLAIELLHDNLSAMQVAVSSRTVMAHIHRLPSILNQAFPGYAASGRLHLAARREQDGE